MASIRIVTAQSEAGQVDWLLASPEKLYWEPDKLTDEVACRLRTLMALGLTYGAINLIRRRRSVE